MGIPRDNEVEAMREKLYPDKPSGIDNLRAELDRLSSELADAQVINHEFDDKLVAARAELTAKDARVAAQAGELSDLHKKYDECRETLLEVSNALKVSEASTAGNRRELDFEKRHVARCKDRIAALEAENRLLRARPMHKRPDFRDGIPSDEE